MEDYFNDDEFELVDEDNDIVDDDYKDDDNGDDNDEEDENTIEYKASGNRKKKFKTRACKLFKIHWMPNSDQTSEKINTSKFNP